jgi:hypothetical protein
MDLLTAEERRVEAARSFRHWPAFAATAAYILISAIAIAHHEPWADEAQSWLLARDAGLWELWTRLLHYEGTTGLWQTLLHLFIRAGLPYSGLDAISGVLGIAAASLVIWRAPFPLSVRIVLPFSYFLCYQYASIARSYDLLPVLVFACAALFHRAWQRPLLFTALLCLMSAVSAHGMILAVSIGFAAMTRADQWKRLWLYAFAFALIACVLAFTAWPAADGTFVTHLDFSFEHFLETAGRALAAAFTGETFTSLSVVALTVPLLWRGGGLLFFFLACSLLCGVYAVVYSQVWHFGALFLAWVFALWISYERSSAQRAATAALVVVIAVQCYWTCCAVRYDWNQAYSGGQAAARGLRELDLANRRLYAIGYACVAIQPYFSRNIFSNWNDGRAPAYWDWSKRNHVNEDSLRLPLLRPDYVIVGYKNDFEKGVWTDLIKKGGYRKIRHFAGSSFWQTSVFEPESFDLYRLDGGP